MVDIEIKRGYEVLPDNNVRFGVRVINNSDSAISDVEVLLDYSESLFELEGNKVQKLGNIPPTVPRTAKFILKPLGCIHKENIGATIIFKDHQWKKHLEQMRPKEVHCVCPFLKEKPITRADFLRLSNSGYLEERGVNFEGITVDKLVDFIAHTCKNRLYKVDEFPIENGKILYLSGDAIGEKAYYLLTAVVKEYEGLTQVLLRANSDKQYGLNGFLNETLDNLRHLVTSANAREIGVIKKERVINIIDSVVQRSTISMEEGAPSIKIKDSMVQRTEIKGEEERKRREEDKLKEEREKQERLGRQRDEERVQREREKQELQSREEAQRQEKEEQERLSRQNGQELRAQKEEPRIKSRMMVFVMIALIGIALLGYWFTVPKGDDSLETQWYEWRKPLQEESKINKYDTTSVLDQYSSTDRSRMDNNNTSSLGLGTLAFTGGFNYIAQSFVPSISGNLTLVRLFLSSQRGMADDVNLTVEIRDHDNLNNCPNCYSLSTANIPYFNTNWHWEDVIFSNPPYLKSGKIYYIVVTSSTNYAFMVFPSYPNGTYYYSGNGYSWDTFGDKNDVDFETYIDPTAKPPQDLQINDTDGDGVPDICDLCPNIFGIKEAKGCLPVNLNNSIGMDFMLIPAGEFDMGSPSNGEYDDEGPVHRVKISKAFYMGKYEVTQKQWREVMGTNPSYFKGENQSVEQVSWNDAQEFIKKLNEKEGANKYRLPSEAEWEYAARAGTTTRYFFGNDESKFGDYAWVIANSGDKTHEVGQKKPNPWGLYDIYGNVWEWVQDVYHNRYNGAPIDGSAWEGNGSNRTVRGGSNRNLGSAGRIGSAPNTRDSHIGFRLVRDV